MFSHSFGIEFKILLCNYKLTGLWVFYENQDDNVVQVSSYESYLLHFLSNILIVVRVVSSFLAHPNNMCESRKR